MKLVTYRHGDRELAGALTADMAAVLPLPYSDMNDPIGSASFTELLSAAQAADEISFPPALAISSRVNGELRQNSTTDLLITGIAEIMEELSSGMTLLPGTIIATGTPAGVGMGFDPPKFLSPSDVVECSIEGIGTLRNTVR